MVKEMQLKDYKFFGVYDYEKIAYDFWKTGYYSNKLDLIGAIQKFGNGALIEKKVIGSVQMVLQNIDEYDKRYNGEMK